MNKRGFLPALAALPFMSIALAVIVLVLGLTFGFKVIFTTTGMFYAVGIGIIAMTFIYALPAALSGDFTIQKRNLILVFFLVGIGIIAVGAIGSFQQSFGAPEFIQIPLKGYYECAAGSASILSVAKALPSAETALSCPANAEKCDITITYTQPSDVRTSISYLQYVRNGVVTKSATVGSSATEVGKTISLTAFNVAKGESIIATLKRDQVLDFAGEFNAAGASYSAKYNPFILWKTSPTAGRVEYSSIEQGCSFTNEDIGTLLLKDTTDNNLGTGRVGDVLEPFKTRAFIDIIVPAHLENAKIQGDKYCSNKQLYQIDEISTTINSYRVVNTNKVTGTVECCSGDVEPGIRQCIDNKWVSLPKPNEQPAAGQEIQCSLFKPCAGPDFVPYTGTQLIHSVCESGICLQRTKDVECSTSAACKDPAKSVCDTFTYTCVVAPAPIATIVSPVTQEDQEDIAACESKARSQPWAGWSYVVTKDEPGLFESIVTLGFARAHERGECKASFLGYYTVAGIIVVFGTIIILLLRNPARRKAK